MSEPTQKPRKFRAFPQTVGECVEPLTRPVFKAQGLAHARLITHWAHVVGPQLALRCHPLKLQFPRQSQNGGTLTIGCEPGFALELQHMQPVILERLAAYFGYKAIDRLAFQPLSAPKAARPSVKIKRPTLPKDAAKFSDTADDPELREALASLARTLSGSSS